MLGHILDISILAEDGIVVLDGQYNRVRLFGIKDGNFIGDFSNSGRGPGEITYPVQTATNDDLIFVSDRLSKVEIFSVGADEIIHQDQISLKFSPTGICIIDSTLFISGLDLKNNNTIHSYNLHTREHLKSFGKPYKSKNILAKVSLTRNDIICNQKTKTLVSVSEYLPYITGYSMKGEIKWRSKLKEFYQEKVEERFDSEGAPKITKSFNVDGFTDGYGSLTEVKDSDFVIIQIIRIERENNVTTKGYILTYRLDSINGEAALLSYTLPVIKAINQDVIASFNSKDSFPEILLYKTPNEFYQE